MPIKARAGTVVQLRISARLRDTLQVVPNLPVYLDRQDQAAGPWEQVSGAQSDASGDAPVSLTLPSTPGQVRLRARSPGVAEQYRSDTSPTLTIDVV